MFKDTRSAKANPGVFIDIDGVVLKGGKPFEWSTQALNVNLYSLNCCANYFYNRLNSLKNLDPLG